MNAFAHVSSSGVLSFLMWCLLSTNILHLVLLRKDPDRVVHILIKIADPPPKPCRLGAMVNLNSSTKVRVMEEGSLDLTYINNWPKMAIIAVLCLPLMSLQSSSDSMQPLQDFTECFFGLLLLDFALAFLNICDVNCM